MQVKTNLKDMFSYSIIPIVVLLIILLILFIILFNRKKKPIKEVVKIPTQKDLNSIKNKYINYIINLTNNYNNKSITSRKAYQELSKIIRNFVYEATNIKVQNYTLEEIKLINMPILYELINEYYNPEFALENNGNIIDSINKTRMVIERWN